MEPHFHQLDRLKNHCTPVEAVYSRFFVVNGVGGYQCPISSRVTRSGTSSLHPYNNAANSASNADAMACLMMEDKVRTEKLLNHSSFAFVK